MRKSRKGLIVLIAVMTLFGFSLVSASQINVSITESQILEQEGDKSTYKMQLEFNNPSLLILNAGQTEFIVSTNDEKIGNGVLEPFILPALGSIVVDGTFHREKEFDSNDIPIIKISGITKYDVLFTSLEIPFVYYPTIDQAREFIQQD